MRTQPEVVNTIFIHRGIVVPKGTTPDNPLAVKNRSTGEATGLTIKGGFILPSMSNKDSIEKARQRAARWGDRYTNPILETLILSFKITRENFELLKGRIAIFYLGDHEEPIQTFDDLLRETEEAERLGDPGLTFNGEGLSEIDIRRLELVIGRKNAEGEFVFKTYGEYKVNKEGSNIEKEIPSNPGG